MAFSGNTSVIYQKKKFTLSVVNISSNSSRNLTEQRNEICWTIMARFENTPSIERFMFISFAIFGFFATLVNGLVINGIKRTNQSDNKSTRLILFISACDTPRAIISYVCIPIAVAFKTTLSCALKLLMVFASYFWIYITAYLFTFVALDRYLRVTLLQDYQNYLTESKFKGGILVLVLLAIYQALSLCLGPFIIGKENTAFSTVLINAIMFVATILFYLLSIKRLHHIASNNTISNESRKITTIASAYLVIYFICYLPVILYQSMSKMIFTNPDIQITGIVRILTYLVQDLIIILNGLFFLFQNRQCARFYKQNLLSMKRRLVQSNQVGPLQ